MDAIFTLADARCVRIRIDDDYTVTVATYVGGQKVGAFHFKEVENAAPSRNYLRLARYELDRLDSSYLRQGIGRRILSLMRAHSDMAIVATLDDGELKVDDGHPTDAAYAFVGKMRQEGLIAP